MTNTLPAPELSNGRRITIRALLVIAASLLVLGALGGLTAGAIGLGSTRVAADAKTLPATMRALTVDAADLPMAVRVTADPRAREPRVELRFVSSAGVGRHGLDVTSDSAGTRVAIRGESPQWLHWARAGELTVVLPPRVSGQLHLTTIQRFGVLMVNADLDTLTARADNGAVTLRGSARTVEVRTHDGSVRTREPLSVRESFSANTVDGDIDVDFDEIPARLQAVSIGGDVTVGLPGSGPFAVDAGTDSNQGDTVVRVPRTADPAAARAVVTAWSSTGDVTVRDRR